MGNQKIRSVMEDIVFDVDNICYSYMAILGIAKIDSDTDVKDLIGNERISLSNNFGDGPFTTSDSVGGIIESASDENKLAAFRNYLVVAFCNTFEKAVRGIGDACGIAEPGRVNKFKNLDGSFSEIKIINYWMRIFNVRLRSLDISSYSHMAVNDHAVRYWESMFRARNRIVHHACKATERQVSESGYPWGCKVVGDAIKTQHNFVDDIAQFFDNSFCNFVIDIDNTFKEG